MLEEDLVTGEKKLKFKQRMNNVVEMATFGETLFPVSLQHPSSHTYPSEGSLPQNWPHSFP